MIRITNDGITLSTKAYTSNSKFLSLNIEIDKRVRDITKRWTTKNRQALHVVIMNMLACIKHKQRLYYSRDKIAKMPAIYNSRNLSNYNIMNAIDQLEQEGYLFNYVAERDYSDNDDKVSSYVVPTELFVDKFITNHKRCDTLAQEAETLHLLSNINVELRGKNKQAILYEFTENIQEAERVVAAVNLLNSKHTAIDYAGDRMVNIYSRIFNETMEKGGRWFKAAILKIKNKKYKNRLKTTIDGESVVEIDYDCLHINMLADALGITKYRGMDIYYYVLEKQHYSADNRRLIKLGINIMLNAKSEYSAKNAINELIREEKKGTYCYSNGEQVIRQIYKMLPEFKSKFCSKECTGLLLQNKDSWIAHYVLDEFVKIQQPILVVHDSFIVQRKNADKLVEAMSYAYKRVVQCDRVVNMKMNWLENGELQTVDCSK